MLLRPVKMEALVQIMEILEGVNVRLAGQGTVVKSVSIQTIFSDHLP